MRKIFLAFCLYFISTAFINAQSVSNNKFSVSVDLGAGSVFGHSNLSSYGVDYRKEYKSGFSGNIKASYLLNKAFQVGLKFNLFSASENYNLARANDLAKSTQIAEDVELLYIAPQIGYRTMITDKWCLDCMAGAGYTHYNSESLNKETERLLHHPSGIRLLPEITLLVLIHNKQCNHPQHYLSRIISFSV